MMLSVLIPNWGIVVKVYWNCWLDRAFLFEKSEWLFCSLVNELSWINNEFYLLKILAICATASGGFSPWPLVRTDKTNKITVDINVNVDDSTTHPDRLTHIAAAAQTLNTNMPGEWERQRLDSLLLSVIFNMWMRAILNFSCYVQNTNQIIWFHMVWSIWSVHSIWCR
jgi:hypothetical protein